jgi:RimJ/RimL family protein N-acetyltransferase
LGSNVGLRVIVSDQRRHKLVEPRWRPPRARKIAAVSVQRLSTSRLELRPFVPADADALIALNTDPEVLRYITGGEPVPRHEVVQDILPAFMAPRGRLERWVWAADEKATRAFVGWFSLRPCVPGPTNEAELGYRLVRSAWGRGYATEGATALIAAGFAELGLARIFAQTMAANAASRRVLEKSGLVFVKTFYALWPDPIPGAELGEVEYEIRQPAPFGA